MKKDKKSKSDDQYCKITYSGVGGISKKRDVSLVDPIDPDKERESQRVTMLKRAKTWINTLSQGQNRLDVYVPADSPQNLWDDVRNDPVLRRATAFYGRTVAGLGYKIEAAPYTKGGLDQAERADLEEWIKRVFFPSFRVVFERFAFDKCWSGLGCMLVYYNNREIDTETIDWGYIEKGLVRRHRDITMIQHLNRMKVLKLLPRKDHPADSIWPRWLVVKSQNEVFFAKSFGDPRGMNKKTGETSNKGDNDDAPEIVSWIEYDPIDEAYGYPQWRSAKQDVDTMYNIRKYEDDHFVSNCIPNLIIIAPESRTKDGKSGGDLMKEFLKETAEQRRAGGANRKAIVLEIPVSAVHASSGKFPIEIKEVKGPPPDQFIDLKKQKSQDIATGAGIPPNLISPYDKGLGSGKDKAEDLEQYEKLYAAPDREQLNEILDTLIKYHTPFKTTSLKLNPMDVTDKKLQAEIWQIIDGLNALNMGEKRERMGASQYVFPEDVEKSKSFDEIVLFDTSKTPAVITMGDLEDIQKGEAEQDVVEKVKRFVEENFDKLNLTDFVNNVIPAIRRAIDAGISE